MTLPAHTFELPLPHFTDAERQGRLLEVCTTLEPIFRRHTEERHVPGVAYGVVLDGELIFDQAFGLANLTTRTPVDAHTVFRIASMTKSFAALAILQLRDAGQLRLDDPIAAYVPEMADLVYPTADASLLTVRHLLTMNAGWPQDDPWGDRQLYRSDDAMSEFYRAGVSWSNPPGVTFEYSNYGYMVLGRIITNVAGMPATAYIREQILIPLGMTATVWNATDVPSQQLALGYRWEDEAWQEEPLLPSGGDVAVFAGLFTSLHDLARWVGLFQSAWPPRHEPEEGPLRRSSLREMQQNWRPLAPQVNVPSLGASPHIFAGGYGFGLFISHNGHWESIGHGGGLPGFGSYMCWAPDHGIGVIALANLTYANVGAACGKALETLINSKVEPRQLPVATALATARQQVIRLLHQWDDSLVDTLFADNFFLDRDRAHRQQELAALREKHGQLAPEGPFTAENWLRGNWRMVGERGWCQVAITLSPTVPTQIQSLSIISTLPPSPILQKAAEELASLVNHPTRRQLVHLTTTSADRESLWIQVQLAHLLCGPCTLGDITGGDGATWVSVKLIGARSNVGVRLNVDKRGKVTTASFRPVA
jgi:CubicO group peptidase (beta-lactamase class C family)